MEKDNFTQTIQALNSCRHRISDNHEPSLFEDPSTINTAEYWFASDLYNILPRIILNMSEDIPTQLYNLANTKQIHSILSAQNNAPHFYNIIHQNSQTIKRDYSLRHPSRQFIKIKNGNDTRLSRFACFTLAYNTKHSTTAHLAMAYFMSPGATPAQIIQTTDDIERASERIRCKNLEKTMCAIITNTSKTPIGVIYNKMHNIFMDNIAPETIRYAYNITDTSPITNYMSTTALRMRNNAIARAISRLDRIPKHNRHTFTNILLEEISNARQALLRQSGHAPEVQIITTHIKTCQQALTNTRLNFIAKHILDDIREK